MAVPERVWDTALELTKSARDPAAWALQLGSALRSARVALPSPDLAHLLVSYICFDNHVPLMWKLLDRSLSSNLAPPFLVLALLSSRVVPNRKLHPAAYRLYMELVKRHVSSSSLASQVGAPHQEKIMESIDNVIGLSRKFDLRVCERLFLVRRCSVSDYSSDGGAVVLAGRTGDGDGELVQGGEGG